MSSRTKSPLRAAVLLAAFATSAFLLTSCTGDKATPGPTLTSGDGTVADVAAEADTSTTADGAIGAPCVTKYDCATGVCDTDAQRCVDCNFSADCASKTSRCIKHSCQPLTACASDKACVAADAVCDKKNGVCVDCLDDVDCPTDQRCKIGQCMAKPAPCKSSKQCAATGQVCDGAVCVDCIGDVDCASKSFCNQGICVADFCQPGSQTCGAPYVLRVCAANGGAFEDTPCPAGKACANDKCRPIICKPGEKLCQGDAVFTCDARGVSAIGKIPCKNGEVCVDGACLGKVCEPGSSKCGNAEVLTCKADGQGYLAAACVSVGTEKKICTPNSAGNAVCVAQFCTPSQAFCVGDALHKCGVDGTTSVVTENCTGTAANPEVCAGGVCVAKACQPGAVICKSASEQNVCNGSGSGYAVKACPAGEVCQSGMCGAKVCNPNEDFCAGTVHRKCTPSGGASVPVVDCALSGKVCTGGTCISKLCTPSQKFCSKTGVAVETCAADGLSATTSPCGAGDVCSAGACVAKVCEAQKLVCQGGNVAQCNATGSAATTLKSCAVGKTCIDGACVSSVCGPGTQLCDGVTTLMTCQQDGLGWASGTCGAGAVCVGGACKQTVCVPNGLLCQGNDVHQCATDGTGSSLLKACAAGLFCDSGACVKTLCQAGVSTCDGGNALTCKADGSGWVTAVCGIGLSCQAGVCVKKTCKALAKVSGAVAPAIDIIIFLDTSGSMSNNTKQFNAQVSGLLNQLKSSTVDWRMIVLAKSSGCCKVSLNPNLYAGRLKLVNSPVYSVDGLKKIIDYYPQYKMFLRSGAKVHFIAVTDDDSLQMTATAFEQKLGVLTNPGFGNGFMFHSVVAYGPLANKGCSTGARIGKQYLALTAKTGGFQQAICDAKWSMFGKLAVFLKNQGASSSKCAYGLPAEVTTYGPAQSSMKIMLNAGGQSQTFVKVSDAGACGTSQGFYLTPTAAPTHAVLCEYACVSAAGAPLALAYSCP